MIPQNVLDALAQVRATGKTNMLDQRVVFGLVEIKDKEAADWLRANPLKYMDALNEMGARVKGRKNA